MNWTKLNKIKDEAWRLNLNAHWKCGNDKTLTNSKHMNPSKNKSLPETTKLEESGNNNQNKS